MRTRKKATITVANSLTVSNKGSEKSSNEQGIEGYIASLRKLADTIQEVGRLLKERRQFL